MTKEQLKIKERIQALAVKADRKGIEKLAPEEQVAVLVVWGCGAISNGGLAAFYEGPATLDEFVRALRSLGLEAQADATQSTAQLFPDPTIANADPDTRMEYRERLETDKQNKVFNALSWEALYDAIGRYWSKKN